MRILRIDVDMTVTEIDVEKDDWMTKDIDWDVVRIDEEHDAWVDDAGLLRADGRYGIVAGRRIPLPAYVAGVDGERTVGATIEVNALRAMIG